MSVICDRLQDALEKGDVAELEVAITAAQSALEDNLFRSGVRGATTGKLASLLAKAKDAFLGNLESCKAYLKPLRRACRQLDEQAIFDALVRTQSAPERLQLCMYTDIRRAEELRESIVAARDEAVRLLDSVDWPHIDEFLNEKAFMLDDRTVLALVQRREDLLKAGRGRLTTVATSRLPLSGKRGSPERAGGPRDTSAISSSSNFLARRESNHDGAELRASPVEEPFQQITSSSRRGADAGENATGPVWRSATASQSPANAPGLFSLRPIIEEETAHRVNLTTLESGQRVELYKDAIQGFTRAWAATHLGPEAPPGNSGEDDLDDAEEEVRPATRTPRAGGHRHAVRTAQSDDESDGEQNGQLPEPRTAPPPRASFSPLEREAPPQPHRPPSHVRRLPLSSVFAVSNGEGRGMAEGTAAAPTKVSDGSSASSRHNRVVAAEWGRQLGAAKEAPREATALPPRHAQQSAARQSGTENNGRPSVGLRSASPGAALRHGLREHTTPNVSPIKDATLLSDGEADSGTTRDVAALLLMRSRRTGEGVLRPPPEVKETAVSPDPRTRHDASSAVATPRSYESRRLEVLLRAALEEEDLHRRDIEGTEDFDRCVFLYPMAARIDMLKRSQTERQRRIPAQAGTNMKFWVKAVVDDSVQEQLFVTATSTDELRMELEALLEIPISSLSVQDFQAQVLDRLSDGEDIITVKIKKQRLISRGGSFSEVSNTSRSLEGRPTTPGGPQYTGSGASGQTPSPAGDAAQAAKEASVTCQRRPSMGLAVPTAVLSSDVQQHRYTDHADSRDRTSGSLGSGHLPARGTSPQEMEPLSLHSTSPSKAAPQLMDFPPVAKLWISREEVEMLLTRQFRGKYKPVLSGCFVRTRDSRGYNFFQVASVEKGPHGRIVLDTVYGTELVSPDTISNAAPSGDEIRRWIKKMLNSAKPFPTHGFVEAKLGDVTSALGSARSVLTASPVQAAPAAPAGNGFSNSPSAEAVAGADNQPPPSPVLSDAGEESVPGFRVRRPTVLNHPARAAVPCGRLSVKVNDTLEFTSVCILPTSCATDGKTRALSDRAGVSSSSVRLALFGTRHSNPKARKPRPHDFAGFEMILRSDVPPSALLHGLHTMASAPATEATAPPGPRTTARSAPPPPYPILPSFQAADSSTAASTVVRDRDTTEKGFVVFGAPVAWQGCFVVLGQRRPTRGVAALSPYFRKDATDEDGTTDEEGTDEEAPAGTLVQDFAIFTGATPGSLLKQPEETSLPIPPWALQDNREVTIQRPALVEHVGSLHCFYLVQLDNGAAAEVRSQPTTAVKRKPQHVHHRSSSSQQLSSSHKTLSGGGFRNVRTSITSPLTDPSLHTSPGAVFSGECRSPTAPLPESAAMQPPGEEGTALTSPVRNAAATPLPLTTTTTKSNSVSATASADRTLRTPPPPHPAPPAYSFGLVHAVAVPDAPERGTNEGAVRDDGDIASTASPALHAEPPLTLRWRLVNTKGPLAESFGDTAPLFAVVSSPPEEVQPPPPPTRTTAMGTRNAVLPPRTNPADVSPPDAPVGFAAAKPRELNLLWYGNSTESPPLADAAEASATTLRGLSTTSFAGKRSSFRLLSLKPWEGSGSATVLTPAVSRRRSPALASLQAEHSLGGRVEIPFRRLANEDDAVSPSAWTDDAYFAAVEVDVEKLTHKLASISLFAKDESVFLATVSHNEGRLLVWTLPVTGEP